MTAAPTPVQGFDRCRPAWLLLAATVLATLIALGVFTPSKACADEGATDRPDHIVVELVATRQPLGEDRRPDYSKPAISTVVASFKVFQTHGEVIDVRGYPGNESQFGISVNPYSSADVWDFVISAPQNEPGGIANPMSYEIREVPTPGYETEIWVDEEGVTHIKNTRILGNLAWSKVDSETAAQIGGSEWEIRNANGTVMAVVDNGLNDEDPAAGSLRVSGIQWGSYELVETKAPEGYELNHGSWAFTINAETLEASFGNIENIKVPTPPVEPPVPVDPPETPETPKAGKLAATGDRLPVAPIAAASLSFAALAAYAIRRKLAA